MNEPSDDNSNINDSNGDEFARNNSVAVVVTVGAAFLAVLCYYFWYKKMPFGQTSSDAAMQEQLRQARLARLDPKSSSSAGAASGAATALLQVSSSSALGDDDNNKQKTDKQPDGSTASSLLSTQTETKSATTNPPLPTSAAPPKRTSSSSSRLLKEPPPPASNSTTTATTTTSHPKKKRKTSLAAPPHVVLGQAISHVLHRDVTIVLEEEGSSNTIVAPESGNKTQQQQYLKKPVSIVLPLRVQPGTNRLDDDNHPAVMPPVAKVDNDDLEQQWMRLADSFMEQLVTARFQNVLLRSDDTTLPMAQVVACHSRIQVVLRDGWMSHQYRQQQQQQQHHLNQCLCALSAKLLLPSLAHALRQDILLLQHGDIDDEEEDNDGGLFTDDYGTSNHASRTALPNQHPQQQQQQQQQQQGPLQQLVLLLEEPSTCLTTGFLHELESAVATSDRDDNGTAMTTNDAVVVVKLVEFLVRHSLSRIQSVLGVSSSSSTTTTTTTTTSTAGKQQVLECRLNALSNLLALAPKQVGRALIHGIEQQKEQEQKDWTGAEQERAVWLAPLFAAAAYSLAPAGAEAHGTTLTTTASVSYMFGAQLQNDLDQFPMCVFDRSSRTAGLAFQQVQNECRRTMASARRITESALRVLFRGDKHKQLVFQWLGRLAQCNEAMANLAKPDLLAVNGVAATCASRSFLLGASSALIQFCSSNLISLYRKEGANAFDARYIMAGDADGTSKMGGFFQSDTPLFPTSAALGIANNKTTTTTRVKFTGATEFFFLSCALLRVGLYPLLRMQDEFLHRYHKTLSAVESAAHRSQPLPSHVIQQVTPIVATWLGFKVFLEDPDYVAAVTNFVLLQLDWLLSVVKKAKHDNKNTTTSSALADIPDWMCKEPSRWLSFAARNSWRQLKPHQAEKAVEVATQLLRLGTNASADMKGATSSAFSPVVTTALIRIASSCVQAGVDRALQNQKRKHRRPFRKQQATGDDSDEPVDDDRDVDIYLSFDQNDLGVAVFTNALVRRELCPTLMQAFGSLDIVEGLDVDREHAFDKFQVKLEITDLFLRLWSHPDGECRKSVLKLAPIRIAEFGTSISAAIGYLFDDAILRMTAVCKFSNRPRTSFHHESPRDKQFAEAQTSGAIGNFRSARKLLLLLIRLSAEPTLASILGGGGLNMSASVGTSRTTASDLAVMVIHFLDLLTSAQGGTHPDLEYQRDAKDSTADMYVNEKAMSEIEKDRHASSVARSRYMARTNIGFDASIMCHQLLALATRWHLAALDEDSMLRETPFLLALASHDDCDEPRYEKILERLIDVPGELMGTEAENAAAIFKHDGYVDCSNWTAKYSSADLSDSEKRNRRRAKGGQMLRAEISAVASKDILLFLLDLKTCVDRKALASSSKLVSMDQIPVVESSILEGGLNNLREEEYGDRLSEWVVSSSPFSNPASGSESFLHYFDSTARGHGSSGSGKALIKEARRCHKTLPTPHANSASFLCFAEERMDLCRAVVTGPVDTPYSLGIFVFDVYYPVLYPRIPPLVSFMTTGGGQTRFGPNLYQDGKVCLSLLGTFHALDDSERWNPDVSSLAQIMLSIQTQLLVEEPYFNEPGVDQMKGTRAGQEGSERYNSHLRLATLRYAILDPLRQPPAGFEEVSQRHFLMCRKRIVVQAKRWMLEAKGSSLYPRFVRVYAELLSFLSSMDGMDRLESLPPLADDVEALKKLDSSFSYKGQDDNDGDRKLPANPPGRVVVTAASVTTSSDAGEAVDSWNPWAGTNSSNPWAGTSSSMVTPPPYSSNNNGDESDDEELYT